MKLDFVVLADMANVDAAGKFNIIGEFNAVSARNLPTRPFNIVLVARLIAAGSESRDHKICLAVVDQDGKELARSQEQTLAFAPQFPGTTGDLRAQIIMHMQGIRFQQYAPYAFHLVVDGRYIGDRTLYVVQPQPPGDLEKTELKE